MEIKVVKMSVIFSTSPIYSPILILSSITNGRLKRIINPAIAFPIVSEDANPRLYQPINLKHQAANYFQHAR